ncbi:MAG: alkaline phosphatase [Limisphaerales bacterium]
MVSRRSFLRASGVAASLGTAAGAHPALAARSTTPRAPRAARLPAGAPSRIIHMVADGMSLGTLSCADQLSRFERHRGLAWLELVNHPEARTALMDMRSLDSLVTDSAAASSSWGSGSRVRNGTINVDSRNEPLLPIHPLFGQAGWKRGLVTTTEITHATPAGFTVSVKNRDDGDGIAAQYLSRRVEVMLGGAGNHFNPAKRKDHRDLWAEFAAAGYQVVRTRNELRDAPTDRPWLGTFTEGHLPYSIDHAASDSLRTTVPTLPEMTERALAHLGRHDRFLLQIEGGRVDHACHNNDAAAALRDLLVLDETLSLVLRFQRRHPETLVVVTTDHGNANLGLNGMGTSYRESSQRFHNLAGVRASFPEIIKVLKTVRTEAEAIALVADFTGYKPEPAKIALLLPFMDSKGKALFEQMNSDVAALGQILANHLGIGFTGTTHTSDYVPVVAIGPGSDRFRGMIRNTDIFRIYTDLAGIDHRNPEEPLLASADVAPEVEDIASYSLA